MPQDGLFAAPISKTISPDSGEITSGSAGRQFYLNLRTRWSGWARPSWARQKLAHSSWLIFAIPGGLLAAGLALPLFVLLWRGVAGGFISYLANPTFQMAISLSLMTSLMSVLATVLFGTPLAYWLARRSFRLKIWLELVIDLPIVMPPLIAGIALLLAFGRGSPLGMLLDSAGIRLPFTTSAVVLAQMFVAAPLFIRSARLGFVGVSRELVEAAYTEGANEWVVFTQIMLPLATRAMLNGLVLTWARAFGEFGATIVFAGNMEGRTQTMPLAIFIGFETNLGLALSLSVLLVLISAVVLLVLRQLEKD